jgi:hypothetical protein
MNLAALIDFLRKRLKAVVMAGCVALVALLVADTARLLIGAGGHPGAAPEPAGGHAAAEAHGFSATAYHIAETVPGFWAAFGLLGCLLLVIVSKSFGHAGVSRREDYYHG